MIMTLQCAYTCCDFRVISINFTFLLFVLAVSTLTPQCHCCWCNVHFADEKFVQKLIIEEKKFWNKAVGTDQDCQSWMGNAPLVVGQLNVCLISSVAENQLLNVLCW